MRRLLLASVVSISVGLSGLVLWATESFKWHGDSGSAGSYADLLGYNVIVRSKASGSTSYWTCLCGIHLQSQDVLEILKLAAIDIADPDFLEVFLNPGSSSLRRIKHALGLGYDPLVPGSLPRRLARAVFLDDSPSDEVERRIASDLYLSLPADTIVTHYLNYARFGQYHNLPVVGVEQAARILFHKRAVELSALEAALLVSALDRKLPVKYSLLDDVRKRQAEIILGRLAASNLITAVDYVKAQKYQVAPGGRDFIETEPIAFIDWAVRDYSRRHSVDMRHLPGRLFVTLDIRAQHWAERTVRQGVKRAGGGTDVEGALISMDGEGHVVALVGGIGPRGATLRRATDLRRQPASTFKLFVYLAALERGFQPGTLVNDAPIPGQTWGHNLNDLYYGRIDLTEAFALSVNSVAISLGREVGIDRVISMARRLGISSPLAEGASLALGTSEVTLLELVRAYGVIASGGYSTDPHGALAAVDGRGRIVNFISRTTTVPLLDPTIAHQMSLMLRSRPGSWSLLQGRCPQVGAHAKAQACVR